MMPTQRSEILDGIRTMCELFPSYRLCQMVANTASLGAGTPDVVLCAVSDQDFLNGLRESIRQRLEHLQEEPPSRYEGDTLPELITAITRGLEELSEQCPDQQFVPLVQQVAEWAKELRPSIFGTWKTLMSCGRFRRTCARQRQLSDDPVSRLPQRPIRHRPTRRVSRRRGFRLRRNSHRSSPHIWSQALSIRRSSRPLPPKLRAMPRAAVDRP